MATPIRLKALLRRRHWQTYRAFKVEYDRAARGIDPALVGTWPSRAQLHRWMSGDIKGLPFPDHCRVLEAMFPGWSVEQLFEPDPDPDSEHIDQPTLVTTQRFWERPDVVAAVSKKDLGTVLRLYRKHTGTSQAALSALLELPQPDLAALEGHTHSTTAPDLLDRVAARLRIPPHLSGPSDNTGHHPSQPTAYNPLDGAANGVEADSRVTASHQQWLATRRHLNRYRMRLAHGVARLYPEPIRLADAGILRPQAWQFDQPIDITTIDLEWTETPPPSVNGQHRETLPLRPLASAGRPYIRYSRAMRDLDRPRLFENRICYRLLGVDQPEPSRVRLSLGGMCYFDMIDVGETLAHETALAATTPDGNLDLDRLSWGRLPFRRMVSDPFNLAAYPLMLSISTLTVRRSRPGPSF